MTQDIAELLSEIKQSNGYLFDVPWVSVEASKDDVCKLNRFCSLVEEEDGSVSIFFNADGWVLDAFVESATNLLSDYETTLGGEGVALVVLPPVTDHTIIAEGE